MFLVGHAAIGMSLATSVTSPVLALGVGFISHYLADFFPHGDEPIGEWAAKGNMVRRIGAVAAIDALILLVVFSVFTYVNGFSWAFTAAAIGSALPDVMWGTEMFFGRTLFGKHHPFHTKIHNYFHIRPPAHLGLVFQFVLTVLLWAWLLAL